MRAQDTAGTGKEGSCLAGLNRAWRIFATGVAFATFGLGGIVLSVLVFPLLYLSVRDVDQRKQAARGIVHYAFKGFIWWMRFLGVIDYRFQAPELASARGRIIIANHPTLVDVVAIIALTRRSDCVVKEELFRNPFMRAVVRSTGYISNSEPNQLIADCRASLDKGNNLIIFPEGTRTRPHQPIRFRRGAANIALRTRTPFLALAIHCEPSTLRKGEPWYMSPARKPILSIRYLREIPIDEYLKSSSLARAARRLTADLEAIYQQV